MLTKSWFHFQNGSVTSSLDVLLTLKKPNLQNCKTQLCEFSENYPKGKEDDQSTKTQ